MFTLAGCAIVSCLAFAPALASAMADVATNPIAKPNVQLSTTLPAKTPGMQNYVISTDKGARTIQAKIIRINRRADGTVSGVIVDGVKLNIMGPVAISVATGTGSNNNNNTAQYSQTTTTTQLPGGGTRIDIDHGDGSSTTIVHDPSGGKNGGSRTTTGTDDGEGNTTTTTTTTDGGDGSSTTTITTSP